MTRGASETTDSKRNPSGSAADRLSYDSAEETGSLNCTVAHTHSDAIPTLRGSGITMRGFGLNPCEYAIGQPARVRALTNMRSSS